MSEWFCERCQRWAGSMCCSGCLQINPADARWATEREIHAAREKALGLRRGAS